MGKKPKFSSSKVSDELDDEIARLSVANIAELRSRWKILFGSKPPPAFGRDLLQRALAFRIQEYRTGGLSPSTRQELNQLIRNSSSTAPGKMPLPRRIQAGAVLLRQWNGQEYRVIAVDGGFSFGGKTYNDLSTIARTITGTRWNGPRFFGLRGSSQTSRKSAERQKRA